MQDKNEDKNDKRRFLPADPLNETARNLSFADVVNIAITSTSHLEFFKPIADARKLLHCVTHGQHDAVKGMLQQDISLFYRKGKVTDCSGRTFENISGFEYALWALDKHMWTTILECPPKNPEGMKVLQLLKGQYDKVHQQGVAYTLNGETITERHYDFENTLIKELQTQVDFKDAPGPRDQCAIEKQWQEGVGGAQKMMPMHVVDEYCSTEPFNPVPKFTTQPKSSKQFCNVHTKKDERWFCGDSKLAMYKGYSNRTWGARGLSNWMSGVVVKDLDAVKALYEVRTQDFCNLKSQLEEQATLETHHQVVPS